MDMKIEYEKEKNGMRNEIDKLKQNKQKVFIKLYRYNIIVM